jgi:opacity protein-like surface antigen
MRRILWLTLLGAGLLTAASSAEAQRYRTRVYDRPRNLEGRTVATVHLGISSPSGNLGDAFDSGLGFGGSVGYGVSEHVMLSLGISHHEFDHEVFSDESVSITPVTFNADYAFDTHSRLMPWIGGGIGMYHVNDQITGFPDDDETGFGFNLGAGLAGPIGRRTLLGGGFRYHSVSGDRLPDSEFFTFQVGLGFLL